MCVCIWFPAFTALGYGKVNHNGAWDVAVRLWGTARPVSRRLPLLHPCEHRGAVPISPHPQRHLFSVCRFVGSNYHLPRRREQRSVLTESHGWVRTAESRGAGRAEASGILQEVSLQRKTEGGQGRICKLGYGLESPTQVAHHGSQACRKETPRRAQVAGTLHLAFTPSPSSAFRARV